jgi:hypothetical protein
MSSPRRLAQLLISVREGSADLGRVAGQLVQGLPDDPELGPEHFLRVAQSPGEQVRAHYLGIQAL